jgi:hypothetical protein
MNGQNGIGIRSIKLLPLNEVKNEEGDSTCKKPIMGMDGWNVNEWEGMRRGFPIKDLRRISGSSLSEPIVFWMKK